MAYVNVAEWKPDQVTEWLKGLDNAISQYLHLFLNNEVNGQQLLNVRPEDLDHLGIKRLGHQELILEAVEHLRNFHYELDRENLQLLALRLSCQAHSLHNELCRHTDSQPVSTQTLADVASVVRAVKPLVCWLDRSPFSGQLEYADRKSELLKRSLEIATCAQRDRFAERPVEEIRTSCKTLAVLADGIIQGIADPLILQPASLDLATLRKRGGDDLGFFIVPSFHGVHQIGEIKFGSPAHQCGKVEEGDEVVQVNYQTVVGWQRKKVIALFEESLTDVFLTLKKRPRHTKVYGQIYMKPYRLPSKKRAPAYTRWHENLPSPRPELLTIPDFEMPLPRTAPKTPPSKHTSLEPLSNTILSTSSESDDGGSGCDEASLDYELEGHASPTSMRLYLPKPRVPVQRRATITGSSPTSHRPPVDLEKFWRELKEKKWKGSSYTGASCNVGDDSRVLRDKSSYEQTERPSTCLGFEKPQQNIPFDAIVQSKKIRAATNTSLEHENKNEVNSSNSNLPENSKQNETAGVPSLERNDNLSNQKSLVQQTDVTDAQKINAQGTESKEKRYITRLELMVDSRDSKIEFSEIDNATEVRPIEINEGVASVLDTPPPSDEVMQEKSRKISSDSQLGELPTPHHRERGRLDKSYSTPAYDLSELEGLEVRGSTKKRPAPIKMERKSIPKPDSNPVKDFESSSQKDLKSVPNMNELPTSNSTVISISGAQNTCYPPVPERPQSNREYSTHAVFKFPPPPTAPACNFINQQVDFDSSLPSMEVDVLQNCDTNSNPVLHGRVVETINRHLLDSGIGKEDDDDFGNACDVTQFNRSPALMKTDALKNPDLVCDIQTRKSDDDFQNGNLTAQQTGHQIDNAAQVCDCNQNSPDGRLVNARKDGEELRSRKAPRIVINSGHGDQHFKDYDSDTSHSIDSQSSKCVPSETKTQAVIPPCRPSPQDSQEQSSTALQPKIPSKVSATPPEPPPRPSQSNKSPSTPAEPSKPTTLRAIISGKAGAQKGVFSSPKVVRKKNPLLAKRRVVGVKELGACDYQGWLFRRLRIGGSGAQWIKGWFLLKGTTFYGFRNKEAVKADCFISLPGFTVSRAEEVKSRKFAFKVYHTGTVFYFAAESEEELVAWLDCVSTATLAQDLGTLSLSEGATFSETEDEYEEPEVPDSCFPSPKMRKLTNFLSGHSTHSGPTLNSATASSPKPARSHQNLVSAGESKVYDIQKKFGSLKKLGYRNRQNNTSTAFPQPSSSASSLAVSDSGQEPPSVSAPHSLDRKYLRFLSSGKSQNVPVPTAQFRSYRRVTANENFSTLPVGSKAEGRLDSGVHADSVGFVGDRSPHIQRCIGTPCTDVDLLRRSGRGPGQIRTDEMAGLVTLEQFMLHRQEEERQQQQQQQHLSHHHHQQQQQALQGVHGRERDAISSNTVSSHREPSEAYTGYTEDPVSSLQRSLERRRTPPPLPPPQQHITRPTPAVRTTIHTPERPIEHSAERPAVAPRTVKKTNDSYEQRTPLATKQPRLKNASLYQPPPVAFTALPNFGPTFEMHLDQRGATLLDEEASSSRGKGTGSKLRQLFAPRHGHGQLHPSHRPENHSTVSGQSTPQQKTLLGSPRLHRALFRHGDTRKQKVMARSDSSGTSLNSPPMIGSGVPSGSSSPISSPDWTPDYSSSPKPTMGIAMLGKKPLPLVSPLSSVNSSLSAMSPPMSPPQTPLSPPPDYPGLEYPPVFEPGTYSLSDTSTLLQQSPSLQMGSTAYSLSPETPEQSPSHHYSQR